MDTPDAASYAWFENLTAVMADIPAESIVSRVIYKDAQVNVTLFGFAAGQALSEHMAAQPAIIHILKGEGTLTLGEDEKQVQTGSWVRMPPNMKHSLLAATPLTMLLLMLRS